MTHLIFFYFEILKVPNTTTKYHDKCHFQGLDLLLLFKHQNRDFKQMVEKNFRQIKAC